MSRQDFEGEFDHPCANSVRGLLARFDKDLGESLVRRGFSQENGIRQAAKLRRLTEGCRIRDQRDDLRRKKGWRQAEFGRDLSE